MKGKPGFFVIAECPEKDTAEHLKELLDDIGKRGAPGHSFEIVVDPADRLPGKHGFDGDGSDRIRAVIILPAPSAEAEKQEGARP